MVIFCEFLNGALFYQEFFSVFSILQAPIDDLLLDIVDNAWRMEVLPFDQILVPIEKLPDPEADGGDSHLTLSEQVRNRFPLVSITLVTNRCGLIWLCVTIAGTKVD